MLPVEITALRRKMDFSQPQFATWLGVPVGTVMNWEQGRRPLHGSALMLLRLASRYPEAVDKIHEPPTLPPELPEPQFFTAVDQALVSGKESRRIADELHKLSDQQRQLLDELTAHTVALIQASDIADLHALGQRITRLHELRRMAEYGSFTLQVARATEAAWEHLR